MPLEIRWWDSTPVVHSKREVDRFWKRHTCHDQKYVVMALSSGRDICCYFTKTLDKANWPNGLE